jgi:hypothetical protein
MMKKDNAIAFIAVYVDDILIMSSHHDLLESIFSNLYSCFKIHAIDSLSHYLGWNITVEEGQMVITQVQFIIECLQRFNFSSLKPVLSPSNPNTVAEDDNDESVDPSIFRSAIDALLWIA